MIPADCWHERYMPPDKLASELADGIVLSGWEVECTLVGVMGVQRRRNVDLIRHAYVRPTLQGVVWAQRCWRIFDETTTGRSRWAP